MIAKLGKLLGFLFAPLAHELARMPPLAFRAFRPGF
jgi:hypothetical protein